MAQRFDANYKLVWHEQPLNREVAEVRKYMEIVGGYRKIPIILDDALIRQKNWRYIVAGKDSKGYHLVVSKSFLKLSQSVREAGIWHEVGHVHHRHHEKAVVKSQQELRDSRKSYILNGQIMPEEAEADSFAVERIGKPALLVFLNHLLRTRPKGEQGGLNQIGRRELELRIEYVKNL